MKKHNAFAASCFALALAASCLAACKSAPVLQGSPVRPLDLLDDASSFYIKMPGATDPVLVQRILQGSVNGLADGDAEKIASRISVIYAGLERRRNGTVVQAAVSADIPGMAVKLFRKNDDWEQASVSVKPDTGIVRAYDYFTQKPTGMQIAFPSADVVCIGPSVPAMLAAYDSHAFGGSTSHQIDDAMYSWLDGGDGQIRFYASRPQSFLTILTGTNLNLKLDYVKGCMTTDSRDGSRYDMTIEFEFKDERLVRAGEGMLSLAFGLTDSQVTLTTPTHLVISDILISKKQLYKLFML